MGVINSSNTNMSFLSMPTVSTYYDVGTRTWTKPEGCKKVFVQIIGGGGGAAGYNESGGAGGYVEGYIDVTNISSVSVTVGSGGGGVTYYAVAGDGSTSSFGTYLSATGGLGANRTHAHCGGKGGSYTASTGPEVMGHVGFNGGGGKGHCNYRSSGAAGKGGSGYFGGGAGDRRETSGAQNGSGAWGSGGPGARTNVAWTGGGGTQGIVIVTEFY